MESEEHISTQEKNSEEIEIEIKMGEMEERKNRLYGKNMFGFQEMVIEKAKELKSKYQDSEDYRAYHLLIGSSRKECPSFDFPGEDSIEIFLIDAESKLSEENQ